MIRASKPVLITTSFSFALAACTAPDGSPRPNTEGGAVIGGLIGAVIGGSSSGNKGRNIIVGTAVGAAIGGLVGQELDKQAEALRANINNGEVSIVNTGSELIVTLPEAITFASGSDIVRPSLQSDLFAMADNLNDFPNSTVDIIGHTDNFGTASFNQELSARRADSVYSILADGGVATNRMRAIGRGENEPIASNLNDEGKAQNRRVEIIIRPIG